MIQILDAEVDIIFDFTLFFTDHTVECDFVRDIHDRVNIWYGLLHHSLLCDGVAWHQVESIGQAADLFFSIDDRGCEVARVSHRFRMGHQAQTIFIQGVVKGRVKELL